MRLQNRGQQVRTSTEQGWAVLVVLHGDSVESFNETDFMEKEVFRDKTKKEQYWGMQIDLGTL